MNNQGQIELRVMMRDRHGSVIPKVVLVPKTTMLCDLRDPILPQALKKQHDIDVCQITSVLVDCEKE